MSITVDHANLGTFANDNGGTTIVITTTAAVAAGATIVATFGWGLNTVTLSSVAGGALTWTVDAQKGHTGAAFDACGFARAIAPAGLPSGTVITATLSGTAFERVGGALSFAGVDSSSPVDGTPTTGQSSSSGTAYTTGNVAISAGSVLVSVFYNEGATSATVSTGTKAYDSYTIDTSGQVTQYQIQASAGSYANAGTWGHSGPWCFAAVAYKAAAGGGGDQNLTGAGAIASAEAVGADTVTPGPVTTSPTGIASGEAVGSARLDLNVTPAGIASGETLGSHTVTPGAVTVTPTGIASGEAVGSALVGSGVASAGAISSGETFGTDVITPGPVELDPAGIASGEAFGQATITGGVLTAGPHQLPTLGVG